jgi:hypothetical protein
MKARGFQGRRGKMIENFEEGKEYLGLYAVGWNRDVMVD